MAITDNRTYATLSNRFRAKRNIALGRLISDLPGTRILDVGGLPLFWTTVPGASALDLVHIVNSEVGEHASISEMTLQILPSNMTVTTGDACNLGYDEGSFDLVVCNSVLEHVSGWMNVKAAAMELRRVGKHGWVQVPAYEFPLEVHYMRPFVHWFAEPTRAAILRRTVKRFRTYDDSEFRDMFNFVSLISKRELRYLFPQCEIRTERFMGLPKSHIVIW